MSVSSTAEQPLVNFSNCHVGIVAQLDRLADLPALLAPAERARKTAQNALESFRDIVFEHHAQEEQQLFPAVLDSAQPGVERMRVETLISQLTAQHRALERLWEKLEPDMRKVARGQDHELKTELLEKLVTAYRAHAKLEETEFLPLSYVILSRNDNHMAALGMALHMRHAPYIPAHI